MAQRGPIQTSDAVKQISHRHHFVPEFLLARWVDQQGFLRVHMKNEWTGKPHVKRRPPKSVCFKMDLLMLDKHPRGKDVLESAYMKIIDDRGARAVTKIMREGVSGLNLHDKIDVSRLLLSLDIRRPENINSLKQARDDLRQALNEDPKIRQELAESGYEVSAAELYDETFKVSIAGRAMLLVTKLIDNPRVGHALVNAWWDLLSASDDGEFIVSDAPMVRTHGYDDLNAIWMLPLSPRRVFVAANSRVRLDKLRRMTPQRLVKAVNAEIASQAEKYLITATDRLDKFAARRVLELEAQGERRRKAREERFARFFRSRDPAE